jgi:hypothetical protein
MILTKHAQLREQHRAISPVMVSLIEEHGLEWVIFKDKLAQVLPDDQAICILEDAKHLIRECKRIIKVLKRVEKKASARDTSIQVVSESGVVITETNSRRISRREKQS